MTGLEIKGAISERSASFDTFAAPNTKFFINRVFEVRIFHKCALYGAAGAKLAFRACISGLGSWLKISAAQITISTHGIGMDTFHG
ncbi:unnamed protein product [marine sediment metagenome]|uniref:Uncharacterized protein n=1 Tax=marine sediment metagenome TaxID=412755 RepID=X0W1Y0_9ZZZZ